jgi:hypothetical protein
LQRLCARSEPPPSVGIQLFEDEQVDSVADGVGLSNACQKSGQGGEEACEPNCSRGIETSAGFRLEGVGAIERSGEALGARPRAEEHVVGPISGKARLLSSEVARETLHSSRAK